MSETVDELLANIANLQKQEIILYNKLNQDREKIARDAKDDVLSTEDKQKIEQNINELSAARVNMYNFLFKNYQSELRNATNAKSNLEQQNKVLQMVETELSRSKQTLAEIEQDKNNQLKMVEITDYYKLKYDAQRKLLKFMACSAFIVIVLYIVNRFVRARLPIFTSIVYFIYMMLISILLYRVYDFFSRRPNNFNEHNWWLAPETQEDVKAISENSSNLVFDLSGVGIPNICIGYTCCGPGTTWSPNGCILSK